MTTPNTKPGEGKEIQAICFHTLKQRTVYDKKQISVDTLRALIDKHRPAELFNPHYSRKTPLIIITEYNEDGWFMQYCTSSADKTPTKSNALLLFMEFQYQGFEDCYFEVPRINVYQLSSEHTAPQGEATKELEKIKDGLMNLIACNMVPDEACPDLNDYIDILHKILTTPAGSRGK
jgi:hypothetical protein